MRITNVKLPLCPACSSPAAALVEVVEAETAIKPCEDDSSSYQYCGESSPVWTTLHPLVLHQGDMAILICSSCRMNWVTNVFFED